MNILKCLILILVCAKTGLAQDPSVTNSIGMQFVLIHPGRFQVGVFHPTCPARDEEGQGAKRKQPADPRVLWTANDFAKCEELVKKDATNGFKVEIKQPYYIGMFEVTQLQWKKVMGTNPSVFQGGRVTDDADQHPVDNVTWQDAQAFVRKLNEMEKTKAYRLPTECEWEYAGRAGGPGQVPWVVISKQAWVGLGYRKMASTHRVGTKQPNAWGIYDMLGNVWEWVADFYNGQMFPSPIPPKSGKLHVLKGGSFSADVKNTIYATHGAGPGDGYNVGFRIVRDLDPNE
jgi:formylglycine-generating enzyme required for sulfatase activity